MRHYLVIMVLFFLVYIPLYYASADQLKRILSPNFAACVVLMTLVGVYAPNIQIYFGVIIVIFIATVRGRVDAICRYFLLAAIVPQMLWPIDAGGHYLGAITSADILGISAYVVAKFDRSATSGSGDRRWTTEDSLVLVTFLVMAIGTTGFSNVNDTLRTWIVQFLTIVLPFLVFRSTIRNAADFRAIIACFGVASLFLAVFATYESRSGADIFDIITKHITGIYVRSADIRGNITRASATMGGPLELACFETVGIFALACSRSFFRNSAGYYGSIGVAMLGLIATQSRGSLAALLVSGVVLALAFRKRGIAAAAAIAASLAWPALQVLANVSPAVASFIHGGTEVPQGQYYDYRNLLLERGLQVAAGHPLTGMRMPQVLDALADITQGQGIVDLVNVYLEILLISGIVGLVPFVGLVLMAGVRGAFGFKRANDPTLLSARAFTLAAFTTLLLQLAFVSFIARIPMMFVLSLFGIRLLVQERQAMARSAGLPGVRQPSGPADDAVPAQDAPVPGADAPWVPQLPMISS